MIAVLAATAAGCSAQTPPAFTGEAAWRYLVQQHELGPRVPGSEAHARTIRLMAETLESAGARVSFQRFEVPDPYSDGTLALTNVVGSFFPDEKRRLLLCAHFDSRPWADQETVDSLRAKPVPGANDGASGVAVLLEIAELLRARRPPGLGVDLVFFDGEDYGKEGDLDHYLLGSKHFAATLRGYHPDAGILLDMVGGKGARFYQEGNSLQGAGRLTRELFARAARLGLDAFVPRPAGPIHDDHVPLLRAGIPTVDLIALPYPHWHTVRDTPDKCSVDMLRQVGTLVVDFIYNFGF